VVIFREAGNNSPKGRAASIIVIPRPKAEESPMAQRTGRDPSLRSG
jgi:hypothetical protein